MSLVGETLLVSRLKYDWERPPLSSRHYQHMATRLPPASSPNVAFSFDNEMKQGEGAQTRTHTFEDAPLSHFHHHAQQLHVKRRAPSTGTLLSEVVCCIELHTLPQMQ